MQNTHHVCINFAFKCYLTKGRVKEKKVMEFSITLEGTPPQNLMLAQVQAFCPYSLDLLDLTWDLTWT